MFHKEKYLGRGIRVLFLLFLAVYLITSCSRTTSPNGESDGLGMAEFGYDLVENALSKTGAIENLEDARKIRLSVDSGASNSSVFTDTVLTIDEQNEYLTSPMVLPVNQYRITKYEVLDSADNVILRSPDTASARDDLGQLVTNGLPFSFDVFEDSVNAVKPQVLEVLPQHNAEDFGSPYFGLDTIPTFFFDFSVVYYDTTSNPGRLRNATGYIDVQIVDSADVYRYSFGDTVSTIRVLDYPGVSYALSLVGTVSSIAMDTIRDTLTTSEMRRHVEGEPDYKPRLFVLEIPSLGVVTISGNDSILVDSSTQLTAAISGGGNQTVTWSTSNAAVATVDASGLVTGVAAGTVTITATSTVDVTKFETKTLTVTEFEVYGYRLSGQANRIVISEVNIYSSDDLGQTDLLGSVAATGQNLGVLNTFSALSTVNDGIIATTETGAYVTSNSTGGSVLDILGTTPISVSGDIVVEVVLGVLHEQNNNGMTVTLLDAFGNAIGTVSSALSGIVHKNASQDGFRVVFSAADGSIVTDLTVYDE
jgi:hypothetical protein